MPFRLMFVFHLKGIWYISAKAYIFSSVNTKKLSLKSKTNLLLVTDCH